MNALISLSISGPLLYQLNHVMLNHSLHLSMLYTNTIPSKLIHEKFQRVYNKEWISSIGTNHQQVLEIVASKCIFHKVYNVAHSM